MPLNTSILLQTIQQWLPFLSNSNSVHFHLHVLRCPISPLSSCIPRWTALCNQTNTSKISLAQVLSLCSTAPTQLLEKMEINPWNTSYLELNKKWAVDWNHQIMIFCVEHQMKKSWFYQAYFSHRPNNNLTLIFCYIQRIIPSCEKGKPEDIKEVLNKYLKM